MKRLLITGVPGWLSTAFLDALRAQPVPGLQSLSCLVDPRFEPERPVAAPGGVTVCVTRGQLQDPASLEQAVAGCDAVLHAAGVVHVRRTRDWYDVNTAGTRNLLDAAVKSGTVRRFVYISSNAAAGKARNRTQLLREDDPARPLSHYGRSKLLAEQAVLSRGSALEPVVLRPCMFYGPPVPKRHVEIYRRISHGRMPLVGNGDFARSLTYIDHLVQACRLALLRPEANGETLFIADAEPYTTRTVIEAMAGALGVKPRYLRLPEFTARCAHVADRLLASAGVYAQTVHLVGEADWHVGVSIEKARRLLGFNPTIDLQTGMQRAIAWCRAQGLIASR